MIWRMKPSAAFRGGVTRLISGFGGSGYAERIEKARVHVKAEERVVVKGLTGQHRILIIDE